jgi:hypothetical protein
MFDQNLIIGLIVLAVVVFAVYSYAPKFRGMLSGLGVEGFTTNGNGKKSTPGANGVPPVTDSSNTKGKLDLKNVNKASAMMGATAPAAPAAPATAPAPAATTSTTAEAFSDYASFGSSDNMAGGAKKPAGCYPREQLMATDLLPSDLNSQWAQVNPQGSGDLQGKNFLSAGALIGVNTIGQSLRNSNLQLRSEIPNPQIQVGPWQQSTIEPDLQRRPLE